MEGKEKYDPKKVQDRKNNMDNYTNFIRRIIINERVGGRNSYLLYYLSTNLSLIHHAYHYLYNAVNVKKLSPEVLKLYKKTIEMFNTYYDSFFKKDLHLAHQIGTLKTELLGEVKKQLKLKKGEDNVALYHIGEIVRLIHTSSTVIFGFIA